MTILFLPPALYDTNKICSFPSNELYHLKKKFESGYGTACTDNVRVVT